MIRFDTGQRATKYSGRSRYWPSVLRPGGRTEPNVSVIAPVRAGAAVTKEWPWEFDFGESECSPSWGQRRS